MVGQRVELRLRNSVADEPSAVIIPFHTFLWKVVSRCNLDCDYCYVYRSEDRQWERQPVLMSEPMAKLAARRMHEHLDAHHKTDASIVLHGGEPLLGGHRHLEMILTTIAREFEGSGIHLSVGMQSNLLLFDRDIGDLMGRAHMSIGVSIDGPPHVNDQHRVDNHGRGSGARLESKLRFLTDEFRPIFSGFLCVIDLDNDPIEILDYLASWDPPSIDFLFPLDNHDRLPSGKASGGVTSSVAPYGEWLVRLFDHWSTLDNPPRIRLFESIIRMCCGASTLVESLGLLPGDLIVVETDGAMEAVDSLKSSFDGATALGFTVIRDQFDAAAHHLGVRVRQLGAEGLCDTCRSCPIVSVCGGGYLPHRYSAERGFDNESVYCTDLQVIIRHIHATLTRELSMASGAR